MSQVKVREYKSDDEKVIIPLFEKVFGKPMGNNESINHWSWEYSKNPFKELLIYLAFKNEELLSHYAVIPLTMKIFDKERLGTYSLDTMTDPDYRGPSIFPLLANETYKKLSIKDIPLTYGFPTKNSFMAFTKILGWKEIDSVPLIFRPLNFVSLLTMYSKLPFFSKIIGIPLNILSNALIDKNFSNKKITIKRTKSFGDDYDHLWSSFSQEIKIGAVRNKKYLNWRYIDKPGEHYRCFEIRECSELKGYIILKIDVKFGLNIGFIMDILTVPNDKKYQNYLMKLALIYFKSNNVDIATSMVFNHSRFFSSHKSHGFFKAPVFFTPQEMYFAAKEHFNSSESKDMFKSKNWHVTWGDTDVI